MEVGNSQATAGGAGLPKDVATLYLLALLDVGRVQMAVAGPPRCLIDWVLHHDAVSTNPVRKDSFDCPVCRSDHRIAQSGGEVDTRVRGRAGPCPDASPIAVVRQNPGSALCCASSKSDRVENCSSDENEPPCARVFTRVANSESLVVALTRHADCDAADASPRVEPGP